MQTDVNTILNIARNWVGRNEHDGSHKVIIDTYNKQKKLPRNYRVKYTDSWCATFVSALFIKADAEEMIATECSCENMITGMKKLGIFIEDENRVPKAGDIVFYDWQDNGKGDNKGWSDHVGIVETVNGNTFTVIEGNKNDSVARRNVKVNQIYLRGFAVPHYALQNNLEKIVNEVIAGKWGNGKERKEKLTKAGYDYETIRQLVNKKLKG